MYTIVAQLNPLGGAPLAFSCLSSSCRMSYFSFSNSSTYIRRSSLCLSFFIFFLYLMISSFLSRSAFSSSDYLFSNKSGSMTSSSASSIILSNSSLRFNRYSSALRYSCSWLKSNAGVFFSTTYSTSYCCCYDSSSTCSHFDVAYCFFVDFSNSLSSSSSSFFLFLRGGIHYPYQSSSFPIYNHANNQFQLPHLRAIRKTFEKSHSGLCIPLEHLFGILNAAVRG